MIIEQPEWAHSAIRALDWFLSGLPRREWEARRKEVVAYLQNLRDSQMGRTSGPKPVAKGGLPFVPHAIYEDRMGWYLYLVECIRDRPICQEPLQSSRVFPIFAMIGHHLDLVKSIGGIQNRLGEALNLRKNQPHSTLYEILVALCYVRNGWEVSFIDEDPRRKTPDFIASRFGEKVWVECKKFANISDYTEMERQEWVKRWTLLSHHVRRLQLSVHVDVVFKVPVEETEPLVLVDLFDALRKQHDGAKTTECEDSRAIVRMKAIDIGEVNGVLAEEEVRLPSPRFISLLAGSYSKFGSYTNAYKILGGYRLGDESDGLHACNLFINEIGWAFSAKWECLAQESIDKKAKEVRRALNKAYSQLPENGKSIIHVGYETQNGPLVEEQRHAKIVQVVNQFDFGEKNVDMVICNAMQPLATIEGREYAETSVFFGLGNEKPESILKDMLLIQEPGSGTDVDTHWGQDRISFFDGLEHS